MGVSVGPPGLFVTDCKQMQNTKKERLSQGRIPKNKGNSRAKYQKGKEVPGQNIKKERMFQGRIMPIMHCQGAVTPRASPKL